MSHLKLQNREKVIRIENLSVGRSQNDANFCLEVPEFSVHKGEFVAVVGQTGCGKSTLMDVLGLVLQPDHVSRFEFDCSDRGHLDLRRATGRQRSKIRRDQLGYVLQSGGLLRFLSVGENILLPAKLKGGIHRKKSKMKNLVRTLGISDQLSKKPRHLSGGQRQRASIARALIHEPRLILADEPTAAVDRITAVTIVNELKDLAANEGVSIIMVSHDIDLIAPPVSDRMYSFQIKKNPENRVISRCYEVQPS